MHVVIRACLGLCAISVVGLPAAADAQTCTAAPSGLVGWWPADDSGIDVVGGQNATAVNGAGYGDGRVNRAFDTTGVDDYFAIPSDETQLAPHITVEAWVYFRTVRQRELFVHKINSFGLNTGGLGGTNGGFNFSIYGGGWRTAGSTTIPVAGRWYHVAGTYDGSTLRIYVDGQLEGSSSYAGRINGTVGNYTNAVHLGSDFRHVTTGWAGHDGLIDDFSQYSRALSATEIAAIHAAGAAGKCGSITVDADQDGVPNAADAFPCDATASAESFAPAMGTHGMVMFEDFWPQGFDNDFNDVVVLYNYAYRQVADGGVSQLRLTYNVQAAGGYTDVGLGLALPVAKGAVASVTRSIAGGPATALTPSAADTNLTVQVSSDVRNELFNSSQRIINARPADPRMAGVPVEVVIDFTTPVTLPVGPAPYDVYLFRVGAPGHEIHLSQYCGTANVDPSLFGTGIDASNATTPRCYVDGSGLPAALHIAEEVDYPPEEVAISTLYPRIVNFAATGGAADADYYLSPVGGVAFTNAPAPSLPSGPRFGVDLSCAAGQGSSSANPGTSCRTILAGGAATGDGVYWLDPDGAGGANAFEAYCDMSSDGGGWTLASQAIPVANTSLTLCTGGAVAALDLDGTTVASPAKLSDAVINQLWAGGAKEMLVKFDYGGATNLVSRSEAAWDSVCKLDFRSTYTWNAGVRNSSTATLDTNGVICSRNTTLQSPTGLTAYNGPSCGYSFHTGSGQSTSGFPDTGPYIIYSMVTSYSGSFGDDRGTCSTASAGRNWLGYGNYGCSVAKVFVR